MNDNTTPKTSNYVLYIGMGSADVITRVPPYRNLTNSPETFKSAGTEVTLEIETSVVEALRALTAVTLGAAMEAET